MTDKPDSSPEAGVADTAKPSDSVTDVKSPEPSPAEATVEKTDKGETGDMLSAVKAALKPKETAPSSKETDSKPEADKTDAKEGETDEPESDELTDEELAKLKPKTKKRIDTLLADRADRDKAIETLKPKAEQFEKLVEWVKEADLSSEDVNNLFDIGKNLKSSPRKAYEQIKPVFEQLQRMFGDVLPDDLAQRVKLGELPEPDARALAAARTERAISERNASKASEQEAERRQTQANTAHVTAVQDAVTAWESSKAKADPDWKTKQQLVTREIKLAIHEQGYPKTTADAVKIAEAALAEVNKTFTQLAPRKTEVKSVTDVASSRAQAQPKSMLEAARAGLSKAAA